MEIGSKLPFLSLTLHRPHHLITYNKCAYICTTCFFNKLLYDDPGFHTVEGFYDRLGCLFCRRQNNPIPLDRKSTRLNSSHVANSYAVSCLKKKKPNVHSRNNQN